MKGKGGAGFAVPFFNGWIQVGPLGLLRALYKRRFSYVGERRDDLCSKTYQRTLRYNPLVPIGARVENLSHGALKTFVTPRSVKR